MASFSVDFEEAVKSSLISLKLDQFELKNEQKVALHAVGLKKQDCLSVLPTGFGKSLIFQLIPFVVESQQ